MTSGRSVVFFRVSWISSTNKTECHDIAEILLKVALNTMTLTLLYKRYLLARRHAYQKLTQCYDLPIKFRSCSDGVVIFDFIFFILLQVKQNIYQICNALLIVDRTRFVQKTLLWIHWNRVRLNKNLERILIYRDTFLVIYFLSSIIGKNFHRSWQYNNNEGFFY